MTQSATIQELGEFGLISRIAAGVVPGTGVVAGIGDDAAITSLSPGMHLLTSCDMLLEEVHFRLCWHDPFLLGRKSLAVSISDIAAMGGIPRWALLSLAIPREVPLDLLDAFTRGFLSLAGEHNVTLIGGDTCSSRHGLAISVTIMGEQLPERIVRRDGARPGDDIWVTGSLGDAALGLQLLESESGPADATPQQRHLLSRLLDPVPRRAAGLALAESGLVTAMIDISDGLLADFGHIAECSGVGGTFRLEALPLSVPFRETADRLPSLPFHLALAGGEDYELAFTAPPAHRKKIVECLKNSGVQATPVGIVTPSPDVAALHADGTPYQPPVSGFNHFNSPSRT